MGNTHGRLSESMACSAACQTPPRSPGAFEKAICQANPRSNGFTVVLMKIHENSEE